MLTFYMWGVIGHLSAASPQRRRIVGGGAPTNTAEVIDLSATSPAWRFVAPMAQARRQLNATLLPDGKVLVTGGTHGSGFNNVSTPVYAAEMWDPATESWTTMASGQVPRLYHSTAVLLSDGRVLTGGGDGYTELEAYSPPYLFQGPRPSITAAPARVSYGDTFFVETPDAASITQVTWVGLSSVTHAVNMSQRFVRSTFSPAAGGIDVVAPSNAHATPGPYLLFILNGTGVPSVAKIVGLTGPSSVAPHLTALSPSSVAAGAPAFDLTVDGSNFVTGSTVQWNGIPRPTTFVSSTRLTAQIPAGDVAVAGTASLTVANPAPTGATSNALTFTISSSGCPSLITMDNRAAGQQGPSGPGEVGFTGTWIASTAPAPFGANSLYSNGAGLDTYFWRTAVLNAGAACTYRVEVWWTQHANRSTTVPLTVSGQSSGPAQPQVVNQRLNGGKWNSLGIYTFPAGARGTVQVTDQNGQAAADAVQFVLATPGASRM